MNSRRFIVSRRFRHLQTKSNSAPRSDRILLPCEIQPRLCRLGVSLVSARRAFDGLVPDFITLSKTLGAGLPLSAVLTTPEIEQRCFEKGFLFYTTHASDPLPAAVGLKVIEIILRDKLEARAAAAGDRLKRGFERLQQRFEQIGDVRGRGLMMGVELIKDRHSKAPAPDLCAAVMERCLELGLSTSIVRGGWGVFRIAPPITISDGEIDLGLEIFERAMGECVAKGV